MQRIKPENISTKKITTLILLSITILLVVVVLFPVKVIQIDPVNICSYRYNSKGSSVLLGPPDKKVIREYIPIWVLDQRVEQLNGHCYHVDFWWAPNKIQINYS